MTHFQRSWEASADSRAQTVLVVNFWKETSVLSLFRPSF